MVPPAASLLGLSALGLDLRFGLWSHSHDFHVCGIGVLRPGRRINGETVYVGLEWCDSSKCSALRHRYICRGVRLHLLPNLPIVLLAFDRPCRNLRCQFGDLGATARPNNHEPLLGSGAKRRSTSGCSSSPCSS